MLQVQALAVREAHRRGVPRRVDQNERVLQIEAPREVHGGPEPDGGDEQPGERPLLPGHPEPLEPAAPQEEVHLVQVPKRAETDRQREQDPTQSRAPLP